MLINAQLLSQGCFDSRIVCFTFPFGNLSMFLLALSEPFRFGPKRPYRDQNTCRYQNAHQCVTLLSQAYFDSKIMCVYFSICQFVYVPLKRIQKEQWRPNCTQRLRPYLYTQWFRYTDWNNGLCPGSDDWTWSAFKLPCVSPGSADWTWSLPHLCKACRAWHGRNYSY